MKWLLHRSNLHSHSSLRREWINVRGLIEPAGSPANAAITAASLGFEVTLRFKHSFLQYRHWCEAKGTGCPDRWFHLMVRTSASQDALAARGGLSVRHSFASAAEVLLIFTRQMLTIKPA